MGAKHFGTSAKLNKGINELFMDLSMRTSLIPLRDYNLFYNVSVATGMLENDKSDSSSTVVRTSAKRTGGLVIDGTDTDASDVKPSEGCSC